MSLKRNPYTGTFAVYNSPTHANAQSIDLSQFSALTVFFPAGFASTKLNIYRLDPATQVWVSAGREITVPASLPGYADLPNTDFTARNIRLVNDNAADNTTKLGYEAKG